MKISEEELEAICNKIPNDLQVETPFLLDNFIEDYRVLMYGEPTMKDLTVVLYKSTTRVTLTTDQMELLTNSILIKIQFV